MDFLKELKDNSILVIPNNIKNKILKYFDEERILKDIKLMSFNDLKNGLLYTYDNQAIAEVMKKEASSFQTAKDYINNTYYLTENEYENEKLRKILKIKNYLEDKNLLIKDPLFKSLLKSKRTMYVYGFTTINKFNSYLLELASKYIEIEKIDKESKEYKHHAHHLGNIEDEVIYVAESIAEKLHNNIPIDKIYIANYSNEYYFHIKKTFKLYGIPVYLKGESLLSDTSIGKYFINNLSDNIESLMNDIKKKFDCENNENNMKVFNKLTSLVNSYYWVDSYINYKQTIEEELKTITLSSNHYESEILTTSLIDNIFDDDEFVYLIGFNQKSIPKSYKDEDYIDDSIKTKLMETTLEKNKSSKEQYKYAIKNIKNLTITYKEIDSSTSYLPSTIIDGDYITTDKEAEEISYSKYSDAFNKILYAERLDDLIKFNDYKEDIEILHKTYDIDYKKYDNQFTGINNNKIKEKLEKKGYSYSNINLYYNCPFKFYLSYFYKLSEFESSLDKIIGTAFHKVLEECIKDDTKDINEVYYNQIEEDKNLIKFTEKEQYYVDKIKDELEFIVDAIREQYSHSSHNIDEERHEEPIKISTEKLNLKTNINTFVRGVVDKCLFVGNDVVIIDYKTGSSATLERDYFEYGLSIQLPIYLYLLKSENPDRTIVGMYLQHILQGFGKRDYKLDGITLDDKEKIMKFDDEFPKSKTIKGLNYNDEKGYTYPKRVYTYEDEERFFNIIKNLIEDCINKTSSAEFKIAPTKIDNHFGCEYCTFKDICFKTDANINYLDKSEQEEGEDNE